MGTRIRGFEMREERRSRPLDEERCYTKVALSPIDPRVLPGGAMVVLVFVRTAAMELALRPCRTRVRRTPRRSRTHA